MPPFRPEIVSALADCPSTRRILDIGCNTGELARALAGSGARVVGVEGDPAAASRAREACVRVHALDLDREEIPEPDGSFDALVYADVLEHLIDPWKALSRHRRLLGPGGRSVISVPNVQHWRVLRDLLRGRWDYRDRDGVGHILARDHLRFFTLRGIRAALEGAGYRVETVRALTSRRALLLSPGPLRGFATFQWLLIARPA